LHKSPLSPEILLVAACCRWPDSAARDEAVAMAARGADWEDVLRTARKHRVDALVNHALRGAGVDAPAPVMAELGRRAGAAARHNLTLAAEAVRLDAALAGVDHLFVKGTTLGLLAYGGHHLKSACDIDLLVARETIGEAGAILAGLGYRRAIPEPDLPDATVSRWLDHAKELLWVHPGTGTAVDLHCALTDSGPLLSGVGLASPRQLVPVTRGAALPTLTRDDLYAYLCLHGTYHGWQRLKWLADVAALAGEDPAEIERLHRAAVRLGAGRCSAVALALAARLLGKALPDALRDELRADPIVSRLEALAVSRIGSLPDSGTEVGARDTLRLHASHLLLHDGWRQRLGVLRRKAVYPHRPAYLAVPGWLRPGYSALRLLLSRRT
jgi:hypothetical protein